MAAYRGNRTPSKATAPTPGDDARRALLNPMPVRERLLKLAGVPTAVLEGGDGPPLVLLHGPGEFAATWMRVIPELAETHRVIAPDLPGHGASGMPSAALDVDLVIEWLRELIDETCASSPVVAGHLLGGAIAARFAATHSDRLSGLVLVDTYGLSRLRPSPRFALAMIRFLARPTERTQRGLMEQCMSDLGGLRLDMSGDLEMLETYALERARDPQVKAALRSLMPRLGMPAIPAADLELISVPTTLIWGRDDLQVRVRTAERASAHYGWPLHVIEGAADDPAVEKPQAFLETIRTALES